MKDSENSLKQENSQEISKLKQEKDELQEKLSKLQGKLLIY